MGTKSRPALESGEDASSTDTALTDTGPCVPIKGSTTGATLSVGSLLYGHTRKELQEILTILTEDKEDK